METSMAELTEDERWQVNNASSLVEREKILQELKKRATKREARKKMRAQKNLHRQNLSELKSLHSSDTPKRNRHSDSNSPQDANPKKPKLKVGDDSVSNLQTKASQHPSSVAPHRCGKIMYSEVVKYSNVFITLQSYPNKFLTSDDVKKIERSLLSALSTLDGNREEKPVFGHILLRDGTLLVTCKNQYSEDWLEANIFDIKINEEKITCYQEHSLPEPPTYRFWIPGEKLGFEMIRKLVRNQNHGLLTDHWHFVNRIDSEKGQHIFAKIDFMSAKKICEEKNLVACGFHIVRFRLLSKGDRFETILNGDTRDPKSNLGGNSEITENNQGIDDEIDESIIDEISGVDLEKKQI